MLGEQILLILLYEYWVPFLIIILVVVAMEVYDYLKGGDNDGDGG